MQINEMQLMSDAAENVTSDSYDASDSTADILSGPSKDSTPCPEREVETGLKDVNSDGRCVNDMWHACELTLALGR